MASTSYLSRVIISEVPNGTTDLSSVSYAGTDYKLLVKAKSIPAPVGTPNPVESTTLEDDAQTFEEGIKTSDVKEFTGNLEKAYLEAIEALKGKKVRIMYLYGTDGFGAVAKYAQVGTVTATPSDVGGVDEILEMSVSVTPNTVAKLVTNSYTVTESSGTFTVAAATTT